MSNPIPKEQQTPFERWEMSSFGDSRPSAKAAATKAVEAAAATRLSLEQIARLREEARTKGFAQGMAEGHAAGLEKGRAEGIADMAYLHKIADGFGNEVARADELIAQDILNLALDLAKAMLKTALNVRPELIVPIVNEAIRYLPSLQQPALLYLNPEDANVIRSQMNDELEKAGWRIIEDAQVLRGGCRIDTASNQIDASISTRWERLTEALGKNSSWITL